MCEHCLHRARPVFALTRTDVLQRESLLLLLLLLLRFISSTSPCPLIHVAWPNLFVKAWNSIRSSSTHERNQPSVPSHRWVLLLSVIFMVTKKSKRVPLLSSFLFDRPTVMIFSLSRNQRDLSWAFARWETKRRRHVHRLHSATHGKCWKTSRWWEVERTFMRGYTFEQRS